MFWLLPLLAWVLLRRLTFHGGGQSYVTQEVTLHAEMLNVIHGLLAWPFGTRTINQPVTYRFLFFPLNALFWLFGVYVILQYFRDQQPPESNVVSEGDHQSRLLRSVLILCGGAAALPVLLNLPQRFGAAFYTLLSVLLVGLLQRSTRRPIRWGASVMILLSIVMAIYQRVIDPTSLAETRAEWALAHNYIQAIHKSQAKNLLIVNDASGGFTSPEIVARFAGFHGTVWRSNNINTLSITHCASQPRTEWRNTGNQLTILSWLTPTCGLYAFDGIPPTVIQQALTGLVFHTDSEVLLHIKQPQLVALPPSGLPSLSGTMIVQLDGRVGQWEVLIPDLRSLSYRPIQ